MQTTNTAGAAGPFDTAAIDRWLNEHSRRLHERLVPDSSESRLQRMWRRWLTKRLVRAEQVRRRHRFQPGGTHEGLTASEIAAVLRSEVAQAMGLGLADPEVFARKRRAG